MFATLPILGLQQASSTSSMLAQPQAWRSQWCNRVCKGCCGYYHGL